MRSAAIGAFVTFMKIALQFLVVQADWIPAGIAL
jgi:hypothetical protein